MDNKKESSVYLISAHPYDRTDEEFGSSVWNISADSLIEISSLSDENDYLKEIKIDHESGFFSAFKLASIRKRDKDLNGRFLLFQFENPLNSIEIPVDTIGRLVKYHLNQNSKSVSCYFTDLETSQRRKFRKIYFNGNIESLPISDFHNFSLTGEYGGSLTSGNYLVVVNDGSNGILKIPVHNEVEKRPNLELEIPSEFQFKKSGRHLILVNNSKVFVLAGGKKTLNKEVGSKQLIFFNKLNNSWNELVLLCHL